MSRITTKTVQAAINVSNTYKILFTTIEEKIVQKLSLVISKNRKTFCDHSSDLLIISNILETHFRSVFTNEDISIILGITKCS